MGRQVESNVFDGASDTLSPDFGFVFGKDFQLRERDYFVIALASDEVLSKFRVFRQIGEDVCKVVMIGMLVVRSVRPLDEEVDELIHDDVVGSKRFWCGLSAVQNTFQ